MTDSRSQPVTDVAIAIIQRGDTILICRRLQHVPLGGYWEFPGGKRETDETIEQCVIRECQEELGIRVAPIRPLEAIEYSYQHGGVRIHPFICTVESGEPAARQSREVRWVLRDQLAHYQFPPANKPLLEHLRGDMG